MAGAVRVLFFSVAFFYLLIHTVHTETTDNLQTEAENEPEQTLEETEEKEKTQDEKNEETFEEAIKKMGYTLDDFEDEIRPDGTVIKKLKNPVITQLYLREDKNVFVVSKSDFPILLKEKKYDYILVQLFTQFGCGACEKFRAEYSEAARILREEKGYDRVVLAKIDGEHIPWKDEWQVKNYPSMRFFSFGRLDAPVKYTGGLKASKIVNWVEKRVNEPVKSLNSIEDVTAFKSDNAICMVGYFNEADDSVYTTASFESEEVYYGIIRDEEIAKHFGFLDGDVYLFKDFDEEFSKYDPEEGLDFDLFIRTYMTAPVTEFEHGNNYRIYGSPRKNMVFLVVGKSHEKYLDLLVQVTDISTYYKDSCVFIFVDADKEANKGVVAFFERKDGGAEPFVYFSKINTATKKHQKYPPPDDLDVFSSDDIRTYLDGVLETLDKPEEAEPEKPKKPKSEPLPTYEQIQENLPLTVIVGDNFEEI